MEIRVEEYIRKDGSSPYRVWFDGLDPQAARALRAMLERIRDERRTILMTTHDLARGLELSDRWIILSRGRILDQGASAGSDPNSLRMEA